MRQLTCLGLPKSQSSTELRNLTFDINLFLDDITQPSFIDVYIWTSFHQKSWWRHSLQCLCKYKRTNLSNRLSCEEYDNKCTQLKTTLAKIDEFRGIFLADVQKVFSLFLNSFAFQTLLKGIVHNFFLFPCRREMRSHVAPRVEVPGDKIKTQKFGI